MANPSGSVASRAAATSKRYRRRDESAIRRGRFVHSLRQCWPPDNEMSGATAATNFGAMQHGAMRARLREWREGRTASGFHPGAGSKLPDQVGVELRTHFLQHLIGGL